MNQLTGDLIAIDTNVFKHLLNSKKNLNFHITCLLEILCKDKIKLLVDEGRRVVGEYRYCLSLDVKRENEHPKNKILLRYWLNPNNRHEVEVEQDDNLMTAIKGIMPKGEGTDKVFVYLALAQGRVLITNDRKDIIDEGTKRGERRKKLLRIPQKRGRKKGADILTSEEAHEKTHAQLRSL